MHPSTAMTNPLPAPLSAQLRDITRPLHTVAERAGVMRDLLKGTLPLAGYLALLQNLAALYASLESALRHHRSDQRIGPMCLPPLFRLPAIERDLLALGVRRAGPTAPLVPAMRAYVERLEALEGDAAVRLVAHAYVRYLGDLNGGQVLARTVRPLLPPGMAAGLDFYRFEAAQSVTDLAAGFRKALDALPLSATDMGAVADEACWAFRQHVSVFEELARAPAVTACGHAP